MFMSWNSKKLDNYRLYNTDIRFWNYDELLNTNQCFSREECLNKTYSEMLNYYIEKHINNLNDNDRHIVDILNKQLITENSNKKLNYDIIILIPCFFEEEFLWTLINRINQELKNINENMNVLIVIYLNWYNTNSNNSSQSWMLKKIDYNKVNLDKIYSKKNIKLMTIWYIYDKKPLYSQFRSDIFDAIVLASKKRKCSPIIIWIDADVNKFQTWYLNNIIWMIKWDISFIISQRRWSEYDGTNLFVKFSEWLFLLGEEFTRNFAKSSKWTSISNGRSTSYKMIDILKVRWYPRWYTTWDDIRLWHKITWFFWNNSKKNMKIFAFLNKKIWSNPRRWISIINQWGIIPEQWDWIVSFLSNEKKYSNKIFYFENILQKLQNNDIIKISEINELENYINRYCIHFFSNIPDNYRNISYQYRISKRWNLFYWWDVKSKVIKWKICLYRKKDLYDFFLIFKSKRTKFTQFSNNNIDNRIIIDILNNLQSMNQNEFVNHYWKANILIKKTWLWNNTTTYIILLDNNEYILKVRSYPLENLNLIDIIQSNVKIKKNINIWFPFFRNWEIELFNKLQWIHIKMANIQQSEDLGKKIALFHNIWLTLNCSDTGQFQKFNIINFKNNFHEFCKIHEWKFSQPKDDFHLIIELYYRHINLSNRVNTKNDIKSIIHWDLNYTNLLFDWNHLTWIIDMDTIWYWSIEKEFYNILFDFYTPSEGTQSIFNKNCEYFIISYLNNLDVSFTLNFKKFLYYNLWLYLHSLYYFMFINKKNDTFNEQIARLRFIKYKIFIFKRMFNIVRSKLIFHN